MLRDDWQLTDDVHDFHARAGAFLRSRPAAHNTPLTYLARARARAPHSKGVRKSRVDSARLTIRVSPIQP